MNDQVSEKPKQKKRPGKIILMIASIVWLPISFALPYSFTYHMATQDYVGNIPGRSQWSASPASWKMEAAYNESLRSGIVGLLVALVIFVIWRLDRVFTAKEKNDLKEAWMVVMLGAFATLLWTVWTCAGHLMIRAHDEVHDAPAQLPGLHGPE